MSTRDQDYNDDDYNDDNGVLISADEPCDDCGESMVYDKESGVYDKESGEWICSDGECKAHRPLDAAEELERLMGEGKFVKY